MRYDLREYARQYQLHYQEKDSEEVVREYLRKASESICKILKKVPKHERNKISEGLQRMLIADIPSEEPYTSAWFPDPPRFIKRLRRDPLRSELEYHGAEGYPIGGHP